MKLSLVFQHEEKIMEKADQFIILYNKMDKLIEIIEKYPNKDYILDIPTGLVFDINYIKMCKAQLRKGELYIRLNEFNAYGILKTCKENNIKFFFTYPAKTFYDLRLLKNLGASYCYIDAPLFFQMDDVKKVGLPLRLIPNRCFVYGDIPRESGLHAPWVRPEKLDLYEPYADVLEFATISDKQELALYDIYIKEKCFKGEMKTIYQGFIVDMNNDLVYEGLDEMRLNCGQSCETANPHCLMCDRVKMFEKKGRAWAQEEIKRREENP